MTPLEAASAIVGLETDAIPEWCSVQVGFVNGEGKQMVSFWLSPEMSIRDAVWSLEEAKFRLLSVSNAGD